MGKSCVYLKKLDDVPLDVVGDLIAKVPLDQYVAYYEEARGSFRQDQGEGVVTRRPALHRLDPEAVQRLVDFARLEPSTLGTVDDLPWLLA